MMRNLDKKLVELTKDILDCHLLMEDSKDKRVKKFLSGIRDLIREEIKIVFPIKYDPNPKYGPVDLEDHNAHE